MHIHLSKPLHRWRELLGEVGIIVASVLFARGLSIWAGGRDKLARLAPS